MCVCVWCTETCSHVSSIHNCIYIHNFVLLYFVAVMLSISAALSGGHTFIVPGPFPGKVTLKDMGWYDHYPAAIEYSKMCVCNSWDHFMYAPSQWEMMLHCSVVSHWLGTYIKWSLPGWFCLCAQPMRDDVTLYRRLSLAGRIHKMIPAWIIFSMCPASERRRYNVTSSLIGWAHRENDPWGSDSYIRM